MKHNIILNLEKFLEIFNSINNSKPAFPKKINTIILKILRIIGKGYNYPLFKDNIHLLPLIANCINFLAKTEDYYYYEYKKILVKFLAKNYPLVWSKDGIVYCETAYGQISFHVFNKEDEKAKKYGINNKDRKFSGEHLQDQSLKLIDRAIQDSFYIQQQNLGEGKESKIPKKYYSSIKDPKEKEKRKKEIEKFKRNKNHKDKYDYPWPDGTDIDPKTKKPYKTKKGIASKTYKKMFESASEKALRNKEEATKIPYIILKKVYDKGMEAWTTGHRPGVSQHQWAMGRVNSFITGKGGARKADKDLWEKVPASAKNKIDSKK